MLICIHQNTCRHTNDTCKEMCAVIFPPDSLVVYDGPDRVVPGDPNCTIHLTQSELTEENKEKKSVSDLVQAVHQPQPFPEISAPPTPQQQARADTRSPEQTYGRREKGRGNHRTRPHPAVGSKVRGTDEDRDTPSGSADVPCELHSLITNRGVTDQTFPLPVLPVCSQTTRSTAKEGSLCFCP